MQDHILVLDIETAPTRRMDVRDRIAAEVTHPGNITKADTIAAWNAEKRPAAIEEAVSKTGLDGAFGCVVAIGIGLDDDSEPAVIYGLDEGQNLRAFSSFLDLIPQKDWFSTTIVGHCVSTFDIRFLMQRYIVNRIKPHPIIRRAAQAKPWETEKIFDTMVQFCGVGKSISLDRLCLALGIPGKGDITGADVAGLVEAGRLGDVAEYCGNDVRLTREVYRRMTFCEAAA